MVHFKAQFACERSGFWAIKMEVTPVYCFINAKLASTHIGSSAALGFTHRHSVTEERIARLGDRDAISAEPFASTRSTPNLFANHVEIRTG
jgi:hypothetical protein